MDARVRELLSQRRLAPRDLLVIVAHTGDLDHVIEAGPEIGNDLRRELDHRLLVLDMRRMRIADQPVRAGIDPRIETVLQDDLDRLFRAFDRKDVLFDDRHVGLDEDRAVESADRRLERQRLDQHRHAARRPPARDGKRDSCVLNRFDRRPRSRGQHLVFGQQRAVHIRDHQRHVRHARTTFGYAMGLHCRPSRPSSASASAGPVLPAG